MRRERGTQAKFTPPSPPPPAEDKVSGEPHHHRHLTGETGTLVQLNQKISIMLKFDDMCTEITGCLLMDFARSILVLMDCCCCVFLSYSRPSSWEATIPPHVKRQVYVREMHRIYGKKKLYDAFQPLPPRPRQHKCFFDPALYEMSSKTCLPVPVMHLRTSAMCTSTRTRRIEREVQRNI